MTRKKIHIDELFRNKLKSLSLLVSNKDMEAIDDKKSQYTESETPLPNSAFSDFELEVTEMDWLNTKSKLDIERAAVSNKDAFQEKFDGFEIEPNPEDWPITYKKYLAAKSRKLWWWLGTGILALLIGLSLLFTIGSKTQASENTLAQNKIYTNENTQNQVSKPLEGNGQSSNTPSGNENAEQALTLDDAKNVVANPKTNSTSNSNLSLEASSKNTNRNNSNKNQTGTSKSQASKPLHAKKQKETNKNTLESIKEKRFELFKPNGVFLGKLENKPELNNDPSPEIMEKVKNDEVQEEIQVPKLKPEIITADSVKKKMHIDDLKGSGKPVLGLYVAMINQINYGSRVLFKGNNDFYNSVRKSADKPSVAWTKGIEVGILKYKTQFSIGVQAGSQTFVSNYKYSYRVYDSLPVYNPGRTQIIGYFLLRGRDTFINEENKVKLNKIQVPLSFSRVLNINSRMGFLLGSSVLLDYTSKTTGTKMINPQNNQLYYYKTLQGFERRLNVLPSLNIGINYQVGKNLMLQSSIYGNTAVFGRFKNNFGANEQAYNMGINLKLLYLIK